MTIVQRQQAAVAALQSLKSSIKLDSFAAYDPGREGGTGRRSGLKIRRYLVPWGFDSPSRHQPFDSTLLTSNDRRILPQSYRLNDACCAGHQREPHGKQASHNLAVRQNRRDMEI